MNGEYGMKRYVDINEISDGRLYGLNDMVRADCGDCTGCSACCRGMGESIILDPYDMWRLTVGLGVGLQELLAAGKLELNMVDGLILPNLKMQEDTGACGFLNEAGRCSIHPYRTGICRLFPLGRLYEDGTFRYFLQIHECANPGRTKVKVRKWIDTPDPVRYDKYISDWHYYAAALKDRMTKLAGEEGAEGEMRRIAMEVLQRFYLLPYDAKRDFYEQFQERMEQAQV